MLSTIANLMTLLSGTTDSSLQYADFMTKIVTPAFIVFLIVMAIFGKKKE